MQALWCVDQPKGRAFSEQVGSPWHSFPLREVYTPVVPVSIDSLLSAYMLHPGDRPPDSDAR